MMKRILILVLCVAAVAAIAIFAFGEQAQTLTGQGKGYGGTITATVTVQNGKITAVKLDAPDETPGVGSRAVDELPAKMVEKNSADVDIVSGATYSSKGIIAAVKNAMDPANNPFGEEKTAEKAKIEAANMTLGFGISNSGRIGPGKDDKGTPVYSINQVFAYVLFDSEGRILHIDVDQVEVATPNYDGAEMPHFSGFPGQSYNYDENHDEKVDSTLTVTEESFLSEVAGFKTKRERGDTYKLNTAAWFQEMDRYETLLTGMTVDQAEEWFKKYCSDRNGRPLVAGSKNEQDAAKYDALSDEDKAALADVTSAATMSLSDAHGNILAAIRNAYDNRREFSADAASYGTAFVPSGRVGPGKDNTGTPVYSINEVFAIAFYDADGKITDTWFDQVEVATPNYDGDGMPHFAGYPGQSGWNYDENHDGTVDSVMNLSDDGFLAQIAEWKTKRERGDAYKLNTATWTEEMNAYQRFFVGKTTEEIKAWYDKNCSDRNGRPLKDGSSNEQDAAKYNTLSDEEKAALADVTASATMSLSDAHGGLLSALQMTWENRAGIELNAK